MTEREAYERLLQKYGSPRARMLLGTLRLLSLYDRETILERGLLAKTTLYRDLNDLHDADVSERLESIHLERAVTDYVFSRADEFARALSDRRLTQAPLTSPLAEVPQRRLASPPSRRRRYGRRRDVVDGAA